MNTLLFHPTLVHIPLALAVVMPLVSGALLLAWWRKWLPPRAWSIVVLLQLLLVAGGGLALQSGEDAEERVEDVVSERLIEAHSDRAEIFVQASAATLLLMVAALALASRGLPLAAAAVLATFVVFGFAYRTGEAGGELVYRHGAAQVYVAAARAGHGLGGAGEAGESAEHEAGESGEAGESARHEAGEAGEAGESVRHEASEAGEAGESAAHEAREHGGRARPQRGDSDAR